MKIKTILPVFVICTLFIIAGCKKDDNPVEASQSAVSGAWNLKKISGDSLEITSIVYNYNVTLAINADKTFECREYLKSGWAPYYGTWSLSGNIMTFVYSKENGNKRDVTETYNYNLSSGKLILSGKNFIADYNKSWFVTSFNNYTQEYSK